MRRYATILSAMILAWVLGTGVGRAADAQPTEYQLKAAFLYHFVQFVEWPPKAYAETNAPLVIGVLGDNPFGGEIQRTIQGKFLNNHPLLFQKFESLAGVTNNCHILFISSSEKKRFPEVFAALSGSSILTVGETDRFLESGGMISFVMEKTKIRFEINETAVKQAGLKMSYKLLSLASRVTH